MPSTKRFIVAAACIIPCLAIGNTLIGPSISTPAERHFEFSYLAKIPAQPHDARILKIWIPLAQSDDYQSIEGLRMESPFAYARHRDPQYGNEYLYLEIPAAKVAEPAEIGVSFHAVRREHRVALDRNLHREHRHAPETASLRRFLEPDRRVPLQGAIRDLSAQVTQGLSDPLAKARAIYNYVVANIRYDKSGTGWGNGDAIWACTAKRGNCTDFHSLFIGMMRAAGIPARFEIGFPLPPDQHSGAIAGYHCWAEFYVESYGWIPVDASEAWKHPERRDNFFGANDVNRVQFTIGRDIRFEPAQQGYPLNYFIYPYAELDGKPVALTSAFSFQDRPIS